MYTNTEGLANGKHTPAFIERAHPGRFHRYDVSRVAAADLKSRLRIVNALIGHDWNCAARRDPHQTIQIPIINWLFDQSNIIGRKSATELDGVLRAVGAIAVDADPDALAE